MPAASRFVARLTWDRVAARLAAGEAAILPIGAGAKQHGLHLPMNTDEIQAEWFAGQLADRIGALVWPVLRYGHYPAFSGYAGSVSLTAGTFEILVREIVAGVRRFRPRAVFVLDAGLSTIAPARRAVESFSDAPSARYLPLYRGRRFLEMAATLSRQRHGSHADEIETSVMLAIAPSAVDMSRARASPPSTTGRGQCPLSPDDAASENFCPSGSFGDPELASREKGLALVAAMLEDLAEAAANDMP